MYFDKLLAPAFGEAGKGSARGEASLREVDMNKWMVVITAAALVFGCAQGDAPDARAGTSPAAQDPASVAQAAAGHFDEAIADIAGGDVVQGVNLLLEIILLTGPEESFPEGFKAKIEEAHADFGIGDFAAGGADIRQALKIWDPTAEAESKAAVETESENQAALAQIFKDKLTAARDLLAQGEAKAAVTGILQALLMLSPAPEN